MKSNRKAVWKRLICEKGRKFWARDFFDFGLSLEKLESRTSPFWTIFRQFWLILCVGGTWWTQIDFGEKFSQKIWNKIGRISWTFERFFDQEWIIMSKLSKNVILTEKPKNFQKIRKHQKSQKTFFEPFWYHFWPFLVIWRQTKFTNFTRTPLHQKCQSQDIVQAGPPILFLVYFYDSYLQHIKSCQGKVDFEMKARISLISNSSTRFLWI